MKKLLENETIEDRRKSNLILYIFNTLLISLFIMARTAEMKVFEVSFFLELFFVVGVIRFYSRAHKNKNYALWGFTAVISLYLILRILHFTFIHYNILVLYIAFLAGIFLIINSYLMSSPLYFPRIQWWEYDFRYRGELKAIARYEQEEVEIRVADLRRHCISFLGFEKIQLGEKVSVEIPFGQNIYKVVGRLKTMREDIPGRPIRYGLLLQFENESDRKIHQELKKIWRLHKKANIRRKFADYKEASEVNGL